MDNGDIPGYDKWKTMSEDEPPPTDDELKEQCGICERRLYRDEIFECCGCGQTPHGCANCMIFSQEWMEYFHDYECLRKRNEA